ncbi:hypothetical protein GCM10025771_33420 [Niveibacterium umoris]|uniref:Alpha/beta hydrolase n=1 Tax=Niveibacterium umoris TaxID=1193620 RepID=A0A840BEC5_9RHOO|nr:alpha/beta hydrolase [Niveibacterium umoris]MBB4011465.1 hypothetical protein [Niveibacterium umoris]
MARFVHRHTEMSIQAKGAWLSAMLSHVPDAVALTICFAAAPIASRNAREFVFAEAFQRAGYATLLVDGLTQYEEKRDPDSRFDVPKLADRLVSVVEWLHHQPHLGQLAYAICASGTAAAAAVKAAAVVDPAPFALICRAGRVDLAGASPLRANRIPLLAIAGGPADANRRPAEHAYALIESAKHWHEVPNASERFIEPGALDEAASASLGWAERWRPATLDLAGNG